MTDRTTGVSILRLAKPADRHRIRRTMATIAAAAAMLVSPLFSSAEVTLPITKAVLYASGVGYFEHTGTIDGSDVMKLSFASSQMNDVLKSMVLMDLGGGQVQGVSYGSDDPIERALRSFAVNLSGHPKLSDLLSQLRGAAVVIDAQERISGTILNIETKSRQLPNNQGVVTETVLNLVTEQGIRAIPMDAVASLQLSDERLRSELNQALALLAGSRDTQKKPMEIRFSGSGKREVRVGYLVETPVWKTSYRLAVGGKEPLIQGWAIVENSGDQDWQKVNLSLVSGRPISFIQNLYTPLYLARPTVQPTYYANLMPRMHEDGVSLSGSENMVYRREAVAKAKGAAMPMAAAAPMSKLEQDRMRQNVTGRMMDSSSLAAQDKLGEISDAGGDVNLGLGVGAGQASGGEMGQLFQFTLAQPVDLQRRRSAMLPIVNQSVKAEKVSIYNRSALSDKPLHGLLLTNSTNLKLMAGPVTVFDDGAYAGDAQLDNLNPGDQRLISYAVDLSMNVDSNQTSQEQLTAAKFVQGSLQVQRLATQKQTYTIRNKAAIERIVIIEHPVPQPLPFVQYVQNKAARSAQTMQMSAETLQPAITVRTEGKAKVISSEKTAHYYRYRLSVPAGETTDLTVCEDQSLQEIMAIFDRSRHELGFYVQANAIKKPVRDALNKAIDLKAIWESAQEEHRQLTEEIKAIKEGQERLRRNLNTVGNNSPQGKRYLEKLSQEEDRIDELEGARSAKQIGLIEKARLNVQAKRQDLENYLKDLTLE